MSEEYTLMLSGAHAFGYDIPESKQITLTNSDIENLVSALGFVVNVCQGQSMAPTLAKLKGLVVDE
jgi:hypothetical protein